MGKKLTVLISITAIVLLAALVASGCGDEAKVEQTQTLDLSKAAGMGDTLDQRLDELKKLEMTVEVVEDGTVTSKWTQKNGSWRYDDPSDPTSYTIYNDQKKKTWVVSGDTAYETSGDSESSYAGFSPAMIMSVYAMMPRTGGSDDTWEYSIPGAGKLTMEMKGPQGMPTKISTEDAQTGEKSVIEFKYSNVDNVPDSTFELPANIQIVSGSGSDITVPGASTNMMPPTSGSSY